MNADILSLRRYVDANGRVFYQFFVMDWTNESILRFLHLYKMHPCIWNTKHKQHRTRDKVNEAWTEIQSNMQIPCTIPQLKKKKESLMSAYRAYKTKIKNSTAVIGGAVYKPSWFAFATMDSFLSSVYLCNPTTWSNLSYQAENEPHIEIITDSNARLCEDTTPSESDDHETTRKKSKPTKRPHSPDQMSNSPYDLGEIYDPKRDFEYGRMNYEPQEDECDIIAKLWARKLRKLPDDRKDVLIYKINSLIYKESIDNYRSCASPNMIIPSPVQIFKEDSLSNTSFDEGRVESPTDTKEFETDTLYEGTAKAFKTIKLAKRQYPVTTEDK